MSAIDQPTRPRIYMAGRMAEPCWRPFDVYADSSSCYDDDDIADPRVTWFRGHLITYTGPFRTELTNHSFLHGLDSAAYGGEEIVFRRSLAGIEACDVFFAYFNDLKAFGTLVEVGIAHGMGKRIVVGFDECMPNAREPTEAGSACNDLWFAAQCAEKVFTGSRDTILRQFSEWLWRKYRSTPAKLVVLKQYDAEHERSCAD